jgi:hypothetical protein
LAADARAPTVSESDLEELLNDLSRHWAEVLESATLCWSVTYSTIQNIMESIQVVLSTRYARFAVLFQPGPVREGVLANTARQC